MDITITKEIKPCPFCGGIGEIHNEGDWGSIWVQCKECNAEGSWVDTHDGYNENDAIDRWNNRKCPETIINEEIVWLYTHCRAIGMKNQSDSKKIEHDIALFTIELKQTLEQLLEVIKPMTEDIDFYPKCLKSSNKNDKDCQLKIAVNNARKLLGV